MLVMILLFNCYLNNKYYKEFIKTKKKTQFENWKYITFWNIFSLRHNVLNKNGRNIRYATIIYEDSITNNSNKLFKTA